MSKFKQSRQLRAQGPTRVARYLSPGKSQLGSLQQQTDAIATLKSRLWPALAGPLRGHCELANFRGQTLVIIADSPVWAARLRHTSPQILHAARTLCKIDAQKLQIKIRPMAQAQPRNRATRPLAASSASHLREIAEGLEDQELKAILLNIARAGQ